MWFSLVKLNASRDGRSFKDIRIYPNQPEARIDFSMTSKGGNKKIKEASYFEAKGDPSTPH